MKKKIVQLPGDYYFQRGTVPAAIRRAGGSTPSHPYDFTGIPHGHGFSELVIITEGTGVQNINGTSYPVSAGDVFVITGKTTHFFEKYDKLKIVNLMFSDRIFRSLEEYLNRIPGYHLIFRFEPELRNIRQFHNSLHLSSRSLAYVTEILRKMESEFESQNPGYEAAVAALLFELTVFLSRSPDSSGADLPISRLAGLFSALEASFQEDWPLKRMAEFTCMSVNTLLRTFRAAEKQTPLQYLTSLRLNAATSLLIHTDRTVSEIAFSCGFHDSNYFAKRFLDKFGITPSAYRRRERDPSGSVPDEEI